MNRKTVRVLRIVGTSVFVLSVVVWGLVWTQGKEIAYLLGLMGGLGLSPWLLTAK